MCLKSNNSVTYMHDRVHYDIAIGWPQSTSMSKRVAQLETFQKLNLLKHPHPAKRH